MGVLSNAKNEKFAQGIFEGLSQRKAYRAAFPSSANWKDATVAEHLNCTTPMRFWVGSRN